MNSLVSALLRVVLFCAGAFVTFLPRSWELRLGRAFGRLLLVLDFRRWKIARDNMARCLPELSPEERRKLLVENYRHYGILTLELLHYFSPWADHYPDYVRRVTVMEGNEHWQAAHDRGKGVLCISLHMANWELMLAMSGVQKQELLVVTRILKPEWLHKHLEAARQRVGFQCVYQPRTLPAIMRTLRRNGSIGFAMDQYMPPPMGTPVEFFGVKVDSLTAPAVLALRTGAAILPVTQKREPDGRVRIIMYPEIKLGPDLQDPERAAALLTRRIEEMIRDNPSQWLWVHRRFKNLREPVS